ncbi:filamentous hemagglutinin N-terminal domain-containing protein [Phormidium tenue FACHB-886]|nr:filamentous hemagglutinin N-terminal domain-containing protein [Phormidium tenue FACHB-886]
MVTQHRQIWLWIIASLQGWLIIKSLLGVPAVAQRRPVPDDTLGNERSVVAPDVEIRGRLSDRIEGGARRGANLFHSFREFNVEEGRSAYFADPGVENILTRVTGENSSEILGHLGVLGSANLFLINPNGLIFGADASLDIRGSFAASTANRFTFGDSSEFSAVAPQAPPLLTVSTPIGLQEEMKATAQIVSIGNLAVGQDLFLAADNLVLQGQLQAGGNLVLQAQDVQGTSLQMLTGGSVAITGDITITGANPLEDSLTETVRLSNGNTISVNGAARPTLDIRAGTTVGTATDGNNTANPTSANITINGTIRNPSGLVLLTNQYQPNSDLAGGAIITQNIDTSASLPESGGDIVIDARRGIRAGDLMSYSPRFLVSGDTIARDGGAIVLYTADGGIGAGDLSTYSGVRDQFEDPFGLPSASSRAGNGGNVDLYAANGSIRVQSLISTSLSASPAGNVTAGNGGAINLYAANGDIWADYFDSAVAATTAKTGAGNATVGNAGDVSFYAGNGRIISGGTGNLGASASASSQNRGGDAISGDGGDVRFYAGNGDIVVRYVGLTSATGSRVESFGNAISGDGGAISLYAANGDIKLTGGISTSSVSDAPSGRATPGNGGAINLYAGHGSIILNPRDSSSLLAYSFSNDTSARGGNVRLYADRDITTASINTVSQSGSGDIHIRSGGAITFIQANYDVALPNNRGGAVITSDTFGAGAAGNILITARSIFLTDGSQLSASTHGSGQGGNITLHAGDIKLSGISPNNVPPGELFTPAGLTGIPAGTFLGGYVPTGNADNIDLNNLPDNIYPSGIFSQTTRNSTGDAGDLLIQTDRLAIRGGAAIATTTFGQGNAGDISIQANAVTLDSGSDTTGSILSGAARSSTGESGSINLRANRLILDNQASILTETARRSGGDIAIQVDDLMVLRDRSRISTTAGTEQRGGNGGNITIDAGYLVAGSSDNSDISANAFSGAGGAVNITAQGIFGITPSEQLTSASNITASSERGVSGTIQVNVLNVDPTYGLVVLPVDLIDASSQIAQACPAGENTNQLSEFVITGRGGLPPTPSEALGSDAIQVNLATRHPGNENFSSQDSLVNLPEPPEPIAEAQGWVTDRNGKVTLLAQAPTLNSNPVWHLPVNCHESDLE